MDAVQTPRRYDECGCDGADYNKQDSAGTLRSWLQRWMWLMEGLPADVLAAPGPSGWAVVDHLKAHADALTQGRSDLGAPTDPIGILGKAPAAIDRDDLPGLVHVGEHHLYAAGRIVADLGHGSPTQTGVVDRINSSGGGVPKLALGRALVGRRGVEGDRQATRRHHGRPWQALSIWSGEVIDALAAEGHPIAPGLAGENFTIRGADWKALRVGAVVRAGDARAWITAWADPCNTLTPWFIGGDFRRIGHDRFPGSSRAYATVVEPGEVRPGDPFVIEPEEEAG